MLGKINAKMIFKNIEFNIYKINSNFQILLIFIFIFRYYYKYVYKYI